MKNIYMEIGDKPEIVSTNRVKVFVDEQCVFDSDKQQKCEGCGSFATTHDTEGVPLCAPCAATCQDKG